jgi:endo-1,4-beta-xylanase
MNKQILVSALGAMLLASCADHFDQNFETVRPGKEAQYGYLEQYDALKEYIKDRPNFHLGIGTAVDEYNKKELVYALTNSNFNETVAGNAMKMSSCVADDGSMNFDKVSEYVKNATDAGLSVYGHTLAWHAQQPLKYLNGLIADRPAPEEPGGDNMYIRYTTEAAGANPWDNQANCKLSEPLEKGASYTLTMKVKASEDCDIAFWPIWNASPNKNQWGGSDDVQYLDTYKATTEWTTLTWKFNAAFTHDMLQFCFGKLGGTIDFDDVKLVKDGSDDNLVANGDFTTDNISAWGSNYKGPSFAIKQGSGTSAGGNFCITYTTTKDGANLWDHQATCKLPKSLVQGAKYVLTMKVKSTSKTKFAFWPIWNASPNKNQWGGSNDVQYCEDKDISTKWTTLTWEFEAQFTHDLLQFCFGMLKNNESVSIDDITLVKEGTEENLVANGDFAQNATAGWGSNWQGPTFKCEKIGGGIPLSDKEKKEALTPVLQKWIYGMMEATEGKVKAWDVVNEAISGKDGSEFYPLQSATRGTVSADDAKNNFYWQDYLGDIDYVRTAVAAARKGFADAGGNPEELKLFINDYNLETAYDQNKKLKSLIHWIKEWEADGVTKIDGIGSQMHVTCSMDPATQKKNEDAYVNMLNLMVDSHKLVRISELDMGLADKDGNLVNTTDMTEEQHKAMRAYYEFIVKNYLKIVPENQQWGICQWCATDSPANSGWRAGLPVGLWDLDYYRKHTYGGFAAGLGAPEYWNNAK